MRNEYEESVSETVSPADADRTTPSESADARIADDRQQEIEQPGATQPAVVEEVLIEEVSIDGMCGVY